MSDPWQTWSSPDDERPYGGMPPFDLGNPTPWVDDVVVGGRGKALVTVNGQLRRIPHVVNVAAQFVVALGILSYFAFGAKNCLLGLHRFQHFVWLCFTPNGFALLNFAALGVVAVIFFFWIAGQITAQYTSAQIGAVMALVGIALALLIVGSFYYHFNPNLLEVVLMAGGGYVLLSNGVKMTRGSGNASRSPRNTIFGNARSATDGEIDKAARGKAGGFAPMFDD